MPQTAVQPFIEAVGALFRDSFSPDAGSFYFGREFKHHRVSDRYGKIFWNFLSNDDAEVLICFPAKFLAGVHGVALFRQFFRDLVDYDFRATRIDLALDDFTKSLNWKQFDDAFDNGFAHGFQQVDFRAPKSKIKDCGFTYYMGSTGSDKYYRFYDKSTESCGELDAYRLEAQFKDGWAKSVFTNLVSCQTNKEFHQEIVDAVCTPIDFYYTNEDKERISLDWWQNFKDMCSAGISSINSGRIKPTIENSLDWIEKQVETTLANIQNYMDRIGDDYFAWLMARIESGRHKLSRVHQNKIDAALVFAGIPSHISGDELREGWF
jgi:DNA relaxase NicK